MIDHRIAVEIEVPDDPCNEVVYYWECSCGRGGSTTFDVGLASDKHIDYDNGDRRIDVYD